MEESDRLHTLVVVEGSSDRPPTAVEVEGSSDRPPTAVEVEGSSDRPPTAEEVGGSSDRPPTAEEVEATPSPCTLGDLGLEDGSGDQQKCTHTSPSPIPVEMENISNIDSPPPYQAQTICTSDRPLFQTLRIGWKKSRSYLSSAIVLMCLSLLLVNPVVFMLAVGALVHVLAYRRKVNL